MIKNNSIKIYVDKGSIKRWKSYLDKKGKVPIINGPKNGEYLSEMIWKNGLDINSIPKDEILLKMQIEESQYSEQNNDKNNKK